MSLNFERITILDDDIQFNVLDLVIFVERYEMQDIIFIKYLYDELKTK